ncbi:polysaccharide biosynthesis protein [Virgibacillus sp. 6R]|uniref:putative polysaccharide biosynthesis protein n=1 Tax=Metabacillus sp. 22489 TaxID=3453928 RepID=UPI0011A71882
MNVQKNSINLAMQGAVILTIAGIITKVLSAAYRVPYQNIVGDIGFYIYQQVYPFYGMSVILATTGFPVMISKVMMDYGYGKSLKIRSKILAVSFIYLFISGLILFLCLYLFSNHIAIFMGDEQLAPLIRIASLAFIIIPFVSIFRGYYQSQQIMEPTATSQVVEQGVRVSIILLSSYYLVRAGYNQYEVGFGALIGSVIGSVAAFGILLVLWRKKGSQSKISWNMTAPISTGKILLSLVTYSWTIAFSSLLLIFIQLIDALNLYALLVDGGMDKMVAKETKGIYDRGQPLIQLGTVVATSLALSLVPLIARAKISNRIQLIREKINLSIKLCLVVSAGASAGLIAVMKPANVMLFTDNKGSLVLMVLSISILFTSLCLTVFSILQGLGFVFIPAFAVLVGVAGKYALNLSLIPKYGEIGAGVSTVISYCIIALIVMVYLARKGFPFSDLKSIGKIGLSIVVMLCFVIGLLNGAELFFDLENRLHATYITFIAIISGGGIYLWSIFKTNVFTKEELQYIPFIKKFVKEEKRVINGKGN